MFRSLARQKAKSLTVGPIGHENPLKPLSNKAQSLEVFSKRCVSPLIYVYISVPKCRGDKNLVLLLTEHWLCVYAQDPNVGIRLINENRSTKHLHVLGRVASIHEQT